MTWWMRPGPSRSARCGSRRRARRACSRSARGRRCSAPRSGSTSRVPRGPSSAPAARPRGRACRRGRGFAWRGGAGRLGVGDGHDDPERGALGARREPLRPVDHPLVALAHRACLQERRVRPGHVGLGHGEERADLAGDERAEEALLLLLGAEHPEDLAVARVGRLAAEDELGVRGAPDLLVQVRVGEEALAAATGLGREVRRPQPGLLRLRLELRDERERRVVLARDRRSLG